MEHVVFSAAVDGVGEAFRRVSSLEEAVRVVEHLRNDLGIEDASVFELTAVPLAFRTYYRVEVPGVAIAANAPENVPETAPESLLPMKEPAMEPVPTLVPLGQASSMEALESMAEIAGASSEFELPALAPESSETSESSEPEVHQISELPALLASGLEPRDAESEHSLGYFGR